MFFSERVVTIRPTERVLEVGPGGNPHPRADLFLEKLFANQEESIGQRGYAPPLRSSRPIVFFDGERFPFGDDEFDYVICSHVIEHVKDVELFLNELQRVAPRGYLEFPTVYYDFLYDFPEHLSLVLYQDGQIRYLPKSETVIGSLKPVTRLFYESLRAGHDQIVLALRELLFQGFEWERPLVVRRAEDLADVCYPIGSVRIPERPRLTTLERFARACLFALNRTRLLGGGRR